VTCSAAFLSALSVRADSGAFAATGEYNDGTGTATTPGSATPGFTESGANTYADALSWSGSPGVGGVGGRLDIVQGATGKDTTAAYNTTSFNLSNGDSCTTSVMFLTTAPIAPSTGGLLGVGFLGDTTKPFLQGTPTPNSSYVEAVLVGEANANNFTLRGRYNNAGAGAEVQQDTSAVFTLADNTWYKFSATYTKTPGFNTFAYSATVDSYGANGTAFVETVKTINGTLAQFTLSDGNDITAYGGFRVNTGADKFLALDNFAVTGGSADSDNDGLPDTWEETYFGVGNLSQGAADDFEKDGTDNLTEFRLGLIPNSGASRFAAIIDANRQISWPSLTGVTFIVSRSTTLEAGSWTNPQTVPGTAGTATYTDPAPPAGAAFYRVALQP